MCVRGDRESVDVKWVCPTGTEYSTYRGRVEIGEVFLSFQLEHTVQCNFVRDSRYSERGRACIPHIHQAGLIFPS